MANRIPDMTLHGVAFALALLLLLALAWQAKRMQESLLEANHSVTHSLELITAVQAILSSLQDVETGERGFVITGQPAYLDPYLQALERLSAQRRHLDELLAPPSASRQRWLDRLDRTIAERLEIAAANIQQRREAGLQAAAAQLARSGGRQSMENLREQLTALETAERRDLARQHATLQRHLQRSRWLALAGSLLVALLFLAALWAIGRSLHIRQRLASQAQAGQARLRALLLAIPDDLYELDEHQQVRRLSRHASIATPEALGRMLREALQEPPPHAVHALHWRDPQRQEYEIRLVPAGTGRHLAIVRNVTETLEARRRLRDQQAFLRSVVDADENLIFVRSAEGRFQLCNLAFARLLDLTPSQVEGRLPADLPDTPMLERLFDGDEALLAGTGEIRREALLVTDRQGRERCLQLLKRPLRRNDDSAASEVRILAVAVDLSARYQVEKMKAEFISTVSHELRTPLTAIRSALGMLTGSLAGGVPDELRPLLDIAQRNSERLVRLINDILDMEKLEAGQLDFHWVHSELAPLLRQALESTEPYAREYGVRLQLTVLSDGLVRLDSDRFAQIMANLLSNAIKHSPRQGCVEVELERREAMLEVRVRDQGSGIPEAFRPRVFERFAQADASDARKRGGTGLGLAITRSLVQHLGGTIGFDSAPGQGTCFHVRLPLVEALAPLVPEVSTRPHILVLQDDSRAATQLAGLLEAQGYATLIAEDALQGRQLLEENAVDALILSPLLADEDGLALIAELRRQPAHRHLPVLVVSVQPAESTPPGELQGAALGVLDSLQSPQEGERLLEMVRGHRDRAGAPRILHIEDDADVRQLVASLLAGSGIELDAADSLATARQCLAERRYAIVILDLMLPDGDGGELLGQLAQTRPPTPVVIFSARDRTAGDSRQVLRQLVKTRHDSHELAELIRGYLNHWPPATQPDDSP